MGQYAMPAAMLVGTLGSSFLQNSMQSNRANDAQGDAQNFYNKTSLPNSAAVGAQATQNRGQLGQARLGAYGSLSKNLAARGFGSGSGLGIKGATDIESAYVKGIGESQTELTKFANTRQFAPGQAAYGTSVPGAAEGALGAGGGMLNTALGMYMANKMLNPGGGGAPQAVPATAYGGVAQNPGSSYDWTTGNRY
jgi:hypothetical protein